MQVALKSFQPIVDQNSRVLILGTMPGAESLRKGEYYAHEDNLFWDIIYRVCKPDWPITELVNADFIDKKRVLLDNGIALWDVLGICDRKGSQDKHIRNEVRNDFSAFFIQYPQLKYIFFNGKKAEEYFTEAKYGEQIFKGRQFKQLPSTSPSNTMNSFYILKEWMQLRTLIKT